MTTTSLSDREPRRLTQMDQPKCKICGERHKLGVCPTTSAIRLTGQRRGVEGLGLRTISHTTSRQAGSAATPPRETVKLGLPDQSASETRVPDQAKFDKKAYQREYMRARRAKEKKPGLSGTHTKC